jgi:hypothetical protein
LEASISYLNTKVSIFYFGATRGVDEIHWTPIQILFSHKRQLLFISQVGLFLIHFIVTGSLIPSRYCQDS